MWSYDKISIMILLNKFGCSSFPGCFFIEDITGGIICMIVTNDPACSS
jgi:hypothetical protein